MGKILQKLKYGITESNSIISFSTEGGGGWEVWDRYLTIDGKKAYHIGNICGTCGFFFERLGGANKHVSPREVSNLLKDGLVSIESDFLKNISAIIPNGEYLVTLTEVNPYIVSLGDDNDYFANEQVNVWGIDGFWGLPHYPKVQYYRGETKKFQNGKTLFEFIVPIFPQNWLDNNTVDEYVKLFNEGVKPTAITLSVLDIKEPSDVESVEDIWPVHLCLAQYIVDGHHKIYAASKARKPLTILNFISLKDGVSSEKDILNIYNDF